MLRRDYADLPSPRGPVRGYPDAIPEPDVVAEPRPLWSLEPTLLDSTPVPRPAEPDRRAIRLPEAPGETRCRRCGRSFLAAGPTGHDGDRPLCDLCLLDLAPELGMVLALVAVARAFAGLDLPDEAAAEEAVRGLCAFARVYDRFAARSGPPRPFPFDDPAG